MKNRLSKVLASCGVASRRKAEELIFNGNVSVNNMVIKLPQTPVDLDKDDIRVFGNPIKSKEKKVYFLLHKPTGFICSSKKIGSKKIVLELFEELPYRLFTVGRLDRETSGLLVVTNDGHFANELIHPSSGICKEYLVKTVQEISSEHLETISQGAFVEGEWVKPKKVTKVRKGTLKIVLMEGKKREVRSLVEKAGLTLLTLSRIRIGGLNLGSIPYGSYREMTESDKKQLLQKS
jgi:23S rRNA pseudouridine2605 synthase